MSSTLIEILYSGLYVNLNDSSRCMHSFYNNNEGVGAFIEDREIEGACMHHPQFSYSLDTFYV